MPSVDIPQLLKPEIWTGLVGLHSKNYQTPMRNLTRDISLFKSNLSFGATLPLPFGDDVQVSERGALGSTLTFPIPKADKSILSINQNKVATMGIPDEILSNLTMPYINEQTHKIALAQVNDFEKAILKEIKDHASLEISFKTIDSKTIKGIFLQAIEIMNDHYIPASDRFLVLDNKSYTAIMDWLTTIAFAKSDNVLVSGMIGELFGLKLAVSSFADGIYFGHKNGLVRANSLQQTLIEHSQKELSTLIASQNVYGILAPQEGAWLGKVKTS